MSDTDCQTNQLKPFKIRYMGTYWPSMFTDVYVLTTYCSRPQAVTCARRAVISAKRYEIYMASFTSFTRSL